MIFHCGNCQAKYQLPDERVAGRTVRMKCRKCAELIEVKGPPLGSLPHEVPAAQESSGESLVSKTASAPSEGWYAGIDGQPTGPLLVKELAKKLEEGQVTRETLLWREGLEGWKPLSDIAELASLLPAIEESPQKPESPPPIPEPPPSEPQLAPVPRPPRPSIAGIPRPPPARPSAPRASLISTASSRSSAAPKLQQAPLASEEPLSAPNPAPVALAPEAAPEPPPAPEPQTVAPAPEPPKPEPAAHFAEPQLSEAARSESLVVPIPAARRRIHPAAWVVVGLGGVLVGIVAGLSLAEKPKPEVQIVTVSVPVEPPPAPAVTAETPAEPDEEVAKAEEAEAPTEPAAPQKVATPSEGRQKAAAPSAPKPSNQAAPSMTGLSGLSGLNAGPTPGPSKASSTGGGGALSQAEVERVVQSHRAFVKRRCWELALATKTQGAPSSARVLTSITIAPDGRVTNASATGGDGYPGLSSCVAGQVRGWKFPPSEGGTVNVPFVFAAQ